MSEPTDRKSANRAPKITALSTAFPLQFETPEPRAHETKRRGQPDSPPPPRRHDAGQ